MEQTEWWWSIWDLQQFTALWGLPQHEGIFQAVGEATQNTAALASATAAVLMAGGLAGMMAALCGYCRRANGGELSRKTTDAGTDSRRTRSEPAKVQFERPEAATVFYRRSSSLSSLVRVLSAERKIKASLRHGQKRGKTCRQCLEMSAGQCWAFIQDFWLYGLFALVAVVGALGCLGIVDIDILFQWWSSSRLNNKYLIGAFARDISKVPFTILDRWKSRHLFTKRGFSNRVNISLNSIIDSKCGESKSFELRTLDEFSLETLLPHQGARALLNNALRWTDREHPNGGRFDPFVSLSEEAHAELGFDSDWSHLDSEASTKHEKAAAKMIGYVHIVRP